MKLGSLRAKLMMLIGLAILPLALLQYQSARASRARVEVRVGVEAMRLARLVAGHQRAMLESARQLLMTLAEVDCIRIGREEATCQAFLRKLQKASPVYANIGAIDRDGYIYASSQPVSQRQGYQQQPFFAEMQKTREWSMLDADVAHLISATPALVLVYPILGDDEGFAGIVFVAISLEWGDRYELDVAIPPDAVIATVDRQARILGHFPDPEEWVGREVQNPGIMEAILNAGEEEGWVTTRDHGTERIYGVVPLRIGGSGPLYVCAGLNRKLAFAPYLKALRRQILWSAAIGAGALGIAWLLGSLFIVGPTRHLVSVAQQVATGVSNARSRLEPNAGELYEIGTAINRMADAAALRMHELNSVHSELRQAHGELEARVEQRTAELQRARERLVDAISTLEAGFVMFDANERMRACNEPFRQIFSNCRDIIQPGVTFEEILTAFFKNGGEVEGVDDPVSWIAMRMELFREASGKTVQAKINGRWILTSDHRMRDGGIVSLRTDVTERAEAHQALENVAEELQRSNEELEQFAYVVSHDLQEPLRMVASYTELLARRYSDKLDDDARDFIGYAVDGAKRMQQFIDDLLRYSRVSKRLRKFEPVEMNSVVSSALENLRYSREEKHAELTIGDLPEVMGDRVQLTQLFQNLISNAVKFSGPDPLKIGIAAEREGNEWVFSVSDNGLGLSEDDTERVFVIFQRLHIGEEEIGGTGIGLAICKKIVERHGGRIWVKSRPGEGATFYFTLPAIAGTTTPPV